MAASIVAVVVWYSTRPAPVRAWDQKAITATFANLYLTKKEGSFVFTFRYTLENHTGRDWMVPGPDALYRVLANGKGLQRDTTLRWDGGPAVPSGQQINVGVQIDYQYTEDSGDLDKLNEFTKRRLAEIDGFAALDEANRYDLRLPKPPEDK